MLSLKRVNKKKYLLSPEFVRELTGGGRSIKLAPRNSGRRVLWNGLILIFFNNIKFFHLYRAME